MRGYQIPVRDEVRALHSEALVVDLHNDLLTKLARQLPEVAEKLGEDLMWTNEAEEALIEKMWKKPE